MANHSFVHLFGVISTIASKALQLLALWQLIQQICNCAAPGFRSTLI